MAEKPTQMDTGKAFEYAILHKFFDKLSASTAVEVIQNNAYKTAKNCFEAIDDDARDRYLLGASTAVDFLIGIEPCLSNCTNSNDTLKIEILVDKKGELGDVRDVVAYRPIQNWEMGISAKNNHHAVKHSRLSSKINFGKKWLKINASKEYFDAIEPIFSKLAQLKKADKNLKWNTLGDYHETIYKPILDAFKCELLRIYNTDKDYVSRQLIKYLVGTKDFYKVIGGKNSVEIQVFHLYNTLNKPFFIKQPKSTTPTLELPDRILDISYKEDSKTTLIVKFNKNWTLSFRIHNASSRIEPSLKFDINLISHPDNLFETTLGF